MKDKKQKVENNWTPTKAFTQGDMDKRWMDGYRHGVRDCAADDSAYPIIVDGYNSALTDILAILKERK